MTDDTRRAPVGDEIEQVTRNQGGQFIEADGDMIRPEDHLESTIGSAPEAYLQDRDAGQVTAMQVNLERSGADSIYADKAFLNNSGANRIEGTSSKLTQSGVISLDVDTAELNQSSAVSVNAETLRVSTGAVVFSTSEKVLAGSGAEFGLIQARQVHADGDIRAFAVFSKSIDARGTVTSTMSTSAAAVFGAAFATVLFVLGRLFGRKS